jgi:hypothetical protein
MKRSDVIESIVYNCLSWDGLDTSGVPKEEIANDILTHLEKLGMLPPARGLAPAHVKVEIKNIIRAECSWEAEDETK